MKFIQRAVRSVLSLAAIAIASATTPAAACGVDPFIGDICYTTVTYCPTYYIQDEGQMLPIAQFQALYALIGVRYGGDGRTTFALPALNATALSGGLPNTPPMTVCIATGGTFPSRPNKHK